MSIILICKITQELVVIKMDLLNLLINPKNDICFLCYKSCYKATNLYECVEISDDYFDLNLSLFQIMNILFPAHEILLSQACEACTNILLKMFTLMQHNYFKSEMLRNIINNMNKEICEKPLLKTRKYKIKIDVPTIDSIMKNNIENFNLTCIKCNMIFDTKLLLKNHIKVTHSNTNKALICEVCGKTFKNNSALKTHMNCHKEQSCSICSKVLKTHSHYKIHVRRHTTQVKRKSKMNSCDNCEYKTLRKTSLEAHINKTHLRIRPYSCNKCPKSFYKKSNLIEHLNTHERIRDQICEICGEHFFAGKSLKEHIKFHNNDKQYKCNYCDLMFINSGRRLEHMRRRHMEKSECCKVCGRKFSLKKDLNVHMKKMHGVYGQISVMVEKPLKIKILEPS